MQFFGERIREFLGKNEGPPSIVAPLRQSRVFKNAAPREKARENQCFGGPKNCISRAKRPAGSGAWLAVGRPAAPTTPRGPPPAAGALRRRSSAPGYRGGGRAATTCRPGGSCRGRTAPGP